MEIKTPAGMNITNVVRFIPPGMRRQRSTWEEDVCFVVSRYPASRAGSRRMATPV